MRVAVFGAGALGSFFGASLSGVADVVLIGRPAHVRAVRARGLRVSGLTRGVFRLEASTSARAALGADLVLLTTKAYDTRAAAAALRRAGVSAPVLSLQNGLTNIVELLRGLPRSQVLGGATTHGVTWLGPGRIQHAGAGDTELAVARGDPRAAARWAGLFRRAGLEARSARDLDRVLWQKAVVNAAVNPLTAVLRCRNGELLRRPEVELLSKFAGLEAARVARARGVAVAADPWPAVRRVLEATAANRSSMLQDVLAGRATEVDAITGAVVRAGKAAGVPTPVNRALLALVVGA